MKVLVTGGTGFIGSAIVRHLLAAKYDVRILARSRRNQFLLEGLDVEIASGNLTSPKAVETAMKGCSIVVDVASVYAFYPFWEKEAKAMYRINVQGTKNMLNAALKNRIKRYIHTSTIATVGKGTNGKASNENTPFDIKNPSHYAYSKFLAEQEVLKFAEDGLPAVILNPAIVIGQRDYKPTPSGEIIVKFLNQSYPGYFDTTWSVADIDDVAEAHVTAIKKGRVGERYILCNKKHHTMKEMFHSLEGASGVKSPGIKIPYWLLTAFIYTEEFLAYKIFKRKPLLPTEGVKFCRNSTIYDNSKAVRELDYKETPFADTLKKSVLWYQRNSYIEPRGFFRLKARGPRFIKRMMRYLKMDRYTDQLRLDTFMFYGVIQVLHFLKRCGIKPKEDGWRKITQSYLYSEQSKFVLASFRLDFWSDDRAGQAKTCHGARVHIIQRLVQFLKNQPATHWQLKYHTFSVNRLEKTCVDMVHAQFDKNGSLKSIVPYFDVHEKRNDFNSLTSQLRSLIEQNILEAYNHTKDITDLKRPKQLKKDLDFWLENEAQISDEHLIHQAKRYIDRILSAAFIHFETLNSSSDAFGEKRFRAPSFVKRKHPGFGLLNMLCRIDDDFNEVDLWVQYSHIPVDGVPMQEVLKDLKKQWGQFDTLKFPAMDKSKNKAGVPELCSSNGGERGIYHLNESIDVRPFLKYRKQFIAQYGTTLKRNITFAALLMWELTHYAAFEDLKFTVPVDLSETSHKERSLGFVFIRPSIYFDKNKADRGFLDFQKEFDRQLRATRKRKSNGCQLLESYALTPPFMYRSMLRLLPHAVEEFGGTMGLSIIKNAELFLGPYSDVQVDGFIAISNFCKRAEDGSKVCNVSIKGPKNKVNTYMEVIKEVASLNFDNELYF